MPRATDSASLRAVQAIGDLPRSVRIVFFAAIVAAISYAAGSQRGWLMGVVAGLFYGGLFLWSVLWPARARAWSAEHLVVDAALIVPLTFFALAALGTKTSLVKIAVIALVVGAVTIPIKVWQRRRVQARRALGDQVSLN
ncbi:hypothetical protein AB0M47_42485 [Hamadaea sp. NPDC051192]|uniref:hypothetical protein n=1 Tax=Hamadaea sp. NPDC051192 TaxID=3154940 RepID=UPI003422F6FE